MQSNPYQAYAQGTALSGSPMKMVTALYEKAIETIEVAKNCLAAGDALGRSAAISKSTEIVTELLITLDMKNGGEVAQNLSRVYSYVYTRILEGHMKKSAAFLTEAQGLLNTLLEAWRVVAEKTAFDAAPISDTRNTSYGYSEQPEVLQGEDDVLRVSYGGYYREPIESFSSLALSF